MNHLRGIVFAFVLTFSLSVTLSAEDLYHVVKQGETVYAISRIYRVSQEELMSLNNINDASRLQAGRRLIIPGRTAVIAASPQTFTEYQIVKNDTLYNLARTNGIALQTLLDINGFSSNHVIRIGDRIKIPVGTASRTVQTAPALPILTEVRQTTSRAVDLSLRWPVRAREIAYMTGKLYGVVMHGEHFEPVKSLTRGTVISAGPYRGFGRVAIVEVSGGYLYVYGGCESLSVKVGDRIGPGEELGKLGVDALSEKPQLFFMVFRGDTPIDPAKAPRA